MKKKRSVNIDLQAMRKGTGVLSSLVIAGAALTVGCACEEEGEKVKVVSSVEDCVKESKMTKQECQVAYDKALAEAQRTGPKFENSNSCEAQFGPGHCRQSSGGVWMPLMTGFMVGHMLSDSGTRTVHHHHNPVYTSKTGNYVNSSGTTLGSPGKTAYTVPKTAVSPQPKSTVSSTKSTSYTKTVTRGGLGSSGSAKSSWGRSSMGS